MQNGGSALCPQEIFEVELEVHEVCDWLYRQKLEHRRCEGSVGSEQRDIVTPGRYILTGDHFHSGSSGSTT